MMMTRLKIADDEMGYEYYHVQVGAIIQLPSRIINDNGLEIQNIIVQSDNASGFTSINFIPFIDNMNSYNKRKKLPVISK